MESTKLKVCIHCGGTDRQDTIFDNSGTLLNFGQWLHDDCREKIKDKTGQ